MEASDGTKASALLRETVFDVIVSDVRLPGVDGLTLLRTVRRDAPLTDFILMTAFADVGQAVAALKEGASDYLIKPFDVDELLHHIGRIDSTRSMRRELAEARRALLLRSPSNRLVGQSAQMLKLKSRIEMIAPSEAATLIMGESGTGKELVARLLHERSLRCNKPFVAVNCAAFPETLIEAELFGFERGAFTGAFKKREGRFRAADGGTLFLDEIAELPPSAQAKLLRVLQDGTVEPLGTDVPVKVDVRVISATHRNLREHVAQRLFREDLFYRINVLDLSLPPLREREGDLAVLIQFFLDGFPRIDGGGSARLARAFVRCLRRPLGLPFSRQRPGAGPRHRTRGGARGRRGDHARSPAGGHRRGGSGQHSDASPSLRAATNGATPAAVRAAGRRRS